MKYSIPFIFLLSSTVIKAEIKLGEATFKSKNGLIEGTLSPSIMNALSDYDPNFKIYTASEFSKEVHSLFNKEETESPSIIAANFNGDAKTDYAVFGSTECPTEDSSKSSVINEDKTTETSSKKDSLKSLCHSALMIIENKGKWIVESILDLEPSAEDYAKEGKGKTKEKKLKVYLSLFPSSEINSKPIGGLSKRDAIQIETYMGATESFYFDGIEVQEMTEDGL